MSSELRHRWPGRGIAAGTVFAVLGLTAPPYAIAAPPDVEAADEADVAEDVDDVASDEATDEATDAEVEPARYPETAGESSDDEPEPEPEPATEPEPEPEPEGLDDARARFGRAARHYELGEYAEATKLFEDLYRETNEPSLLFNIGQSYWRRFSIEPDVTYLRTARQMFENYDKVMRAEPDYDGREVEMILRSINAQIEGIEASQQASLRPVGPTSEMLEYDRQRRVNTAMTGTGIAFTVIGASAAIAGIVGLLVRANAKFTLDQTGGGKAGRPNGATPEEDEQLRKAYLTGGQVGFAGLIGAGVFLPAGVTLTAVGVTRNKRLVEDRRFAVSPGGRLLTVHF